MAVLSAYPALNRALTISIIEIGHPTTVIPVVWLAALFLFSGTERLFYPETDGDYRLRSTTILVGGVFLYRLLVTVYKLVSKKWLALDLREYAKRWGDEHKVLSEINEIFSLHRFGYCIVAQGWVIAPYDLEHQGFFPVDQLSELFIRGRYSRRRGYYLNAVLVDGRTVELSRNRRRAAIAYRAILKYNPRVRIRPGHEDLFERLLGIWSTLHGLRNDDPETFTLKKQPPSRKATVSEVTPEVGVNSEERDPTVTLHPEGGFDLDRDPYFDRIYDDSDKTTA